jgi:Zn-dependent protease with chaperone function
LQRLSDTMPENERCQTLPPWLWVWFALYVYSIPALVGRLQESYSDIFFFTDPIYSEVTHFPYLYLLPKVPELIPPLILFLGVFTVAFPQVRRFRIEKKYNLSEDYPRTPALLEIEEFIITHAPGLKIKVNLIYPNETVFVYPLGYRKTSVAIFGKLIKSWRSDRNKAEAMLLHEIGHYRNGDALILGAGSFFEFVVKNSFIITALFLLIPTILIFIDIAITAVYEMFKIAYYSVSIMEIMGNSSLEIGTYVLESSVPILSSLIIQLILIIPETILLLLLLFFQTASVFILPVAGIWAAELNADRFMATSKVNSIDNSLKIIGELKTEKSLKQLFRSQITHPPKALRYWMAAHSNEKKSVILFIFLYPAAYLFQLLILILNALSSYTASYLSGLHTIPEILETMRHNIILYMDTHSMIWVFLSIIVVTWPFIAIYWVRFFAGLHEKYNLENYKLYSLCALVLIFASMISLSV